MKKKIFYQLAGGFVVGIFISQSISIFISLFFIHEGTYIAFAPAFVQKVGNEVWAAVIQYLLSGFIGMVFSAGSLIFQNERLGYTIQTIAHFILLSVTFFPIGIYLGWLGTSFKEIALFISIFILSYFVIWAGLSLYYKKKIKELNQCLQDKA